MQGDCVDTSGRLVHPNRMRCTPGITDMDSRSSAQCRIRIDRASLQSGADDGIYRMLTGLHIIAVRRHRDILVGLDLVKPARVCRLDIPIDIRPKSEAWRRIFGAE